MIINNTFSMRKPRIIFFDIDGTEPDLDDYFAVAKSTVPVSPDFDAMAFGDGNNDLEMFGAVGTGVAMANGSDALKAAATDICGACVEDGIYHYCVEHGLIEA